MSIHSVTHEGVTFAGPRGALVGTLAYSEAPLRGAVLLAGPHPYMGGTKDNNVITALADGLPGAGYVTLRFDYHSLSADTVAESMLAFWTTGRTPRDAELVGEARCARQWLREQFRTGVHLLGYSFGGEVVSEMADRDTPSITVIAPTIKHHDLAGFRAARVPKLVLYSNDDFATTQLATESWYASVSEPKAKHCFVGADHFFKGSEYEVVGRVTSHLNASDTPVVMEPAT